MQVDKGANQQNVRSSTRRVDRAPAFPKETNLFLRRKLKMSTILPDEAVFVDFRRQCLSTDNWVNKYDSNGMQVWVEVPAKKENRGPKIHKIKVNFIDYFVCALPTSLWFIICQPCPAAFQCKMVIKDVSAATMYDVLHDGQYRRNWDPTMEDSYDIARLSANADVGYYSCKNSVR